VKSRDQIGLGEARLDVAMAELDVLGDVRGHSIRHRWSTPRRGRIAGASGHDRVLDVNDVRQHLVLDLDQLRCVLSRSGSEVAATAATAWPS
jgi:hypothetical protein